jgi:nitroreductase
MISVIQKRKSIRKYKDTPLTQNELNTIREAIARR